jgi:hypothetical protein
LHEPVILTGRQVLFINGGSTDLHHSAGTDLHRITRAIMVASRASPASAASSKKIQFGNTSQPHDKKLKEIKLVCFSTLATTTATATVA